MGKRKYPFSTGRGVDALNISTTSIAYTSLFNLKKGDIIFTGTPSGVAAVAKGDRLEAFIGTKKMLDFEVK
jgi:2-keto-4-pentenoate hydratase/2-oxohepta-3-ene-1,7-dioic acid hydratase in catechol pathway